MVIKTKGIKSEFVDLLPKDKNLCLLGLTGSRGLGINKPSSDYDFYGIFIEPKENFLGLYTPKETISLGSSEDNCAEITLYEIGHFFKLALKCNPTIINLLFLSEYNFINHIGRKIVENRDMFLSSNAIDANFGGFIVNKIKQLKRTEIVEENLEKIKKDIFYCFWTIDMAISLLESGMIDIPIKNPEKYLDIVNMEDKDKWIKKFEYEYGRLLSVHSIIPTKAKENKVNNLLLEIRMEHY